MRAVQAATVLSSIFTAHAALISRTDPISNIDATKDAVLLFDGMSYEQYGAIYANIAGVVYDADVDPSVLEQVLAAAFSEFGVTSDEYDMDAVLQRAGLLAATELAGMVPVVDFPECYAEGALPATDSTNLGMTSGSVDLRTCMAHDPIGALSVNISVSDVVYTISPTGFGVISDIDDTIKITNVTETVNMVKNTLILPAEHVPGMPELYASLLESLTDPSFIYLTGTPWQFYPFVRDFIHTSFAATPGPIINNNMTVLDQTKVFEDVLGLDTYTYKVAQITRLQGMYPQKTFLALGDSGQTDPEVYGEIYRTFGDFLACIWIRQLEGTNLTAARYEAAFEGVPESKYRLYWDNEIEGLADIDVAGGAC